MLCVAAIAASAAVLAGSGGGRETNVTPAGIVNVVHDLLQAEVVLDSSATTTWVSEPFITSQFSRIGLRFSADTSSGAVTCSVAWRFTDDDAFAPGIPRLTHGDTGYEANTNVPVGDFGQPGRRRQTYPADTSGWGTIRELYADPRVGDARDDFAEVRGTSARVECSLVDAGFRNLGDDPSLLGPRRSVTVRDVKVLLRR
jgi:hypothetical protein